MRVDDWPALCAAAFEFQLADAGDILIPAVFLDSASIYCVSMLFRVELFHHRVITWVGSSSTAI